jgi:hypothetical protein
MLGHPNRVICWFSCGAASAVATKLALSQFGSSSQQVVVARCIVREEHPDNDRFAADCEKWFGVPIVNLMAEEYDGSIYNVFERRSYISGTKGAPCTRLLKGDVRRAFQHPMDRHVFGYTAEEQDRWDDFLDANNDIDAIAPLIVSGVTHADCLGMVERAGIELPVMYRLGFQHNNCIGCAKAGGQGYWNMIRDHFPLQFTRMADLSRRFGVKLINTADNVRLSLDEMQPGTGDYRTEPEVQCGIFCEMAEREYGSAIPGVDSSRTTEQKGGA